MGIKEETIEIKVDEFSSYLQNLSQSIIEYQSQLDNFSSETLNHKEVKLTNPKYFEIISGGLGMKKDVYAVLDTQNQEDIPVFTATFKPVAYFKKDSIKREPYTASVENPNISFASDGDGTAGTNIVYHDKPYYLNTSRLSFKVIDESIYPEYIFFAIQDIKKKYGFDYKHKATLVNIDKIEIKIPIDKKGNFDLEKQIEIANKSRMIKELKEELKQQFEKITTANINVE